VNCINNEVSRYVTPRNTNKGVTKRSVVFLRYEAEQFHSSRSLKQDGYYRLMATEGSEISLVFC